MKLTSRVLILLLLVSFATSQMMNLKMSDALLSNNQVKLRATQQKFSSMMMDFADNCRNETRILRSSAKKVNAGVSRTHLAISELIMTMESFQNITSFPETVNLSTTCDDINPKIIRIEENLRKYAALVTQSNMTSKLFQEIIADVVNLYKIDKDSITLNTTKLLAQGTAIVKELSDFIFMLTKAIATEKNIRVNFVTYRTGNCFCLSGSTTQAATSPAQLLQMLTETEKSLMTDQSALKIAITSASSRNKAVVSLNLKDPVSSEVSRLTKFFTRVSTLNDYSSEVLNATSCGDLLVIIGSANFKSWLMTQTTKNVERNSTCLSRYFASFNASVALATVNLTASQRSALTSLGSSIQTLINAFSKYSSSILSTKVKLESSSTYMKTYLDAQCVCKMKSTTLQPTTSTTSTTTTSTTTTTPAPITTTEMPANLTFCVNTTNIFDTTGRYVKSICFLQNAISYPLVLDYVKSLGMRLYVISSEFEYKAVLDFTNRLFSKVNNYSYRINGNYSDTEKAWFVYNPNKTPLVPQIAPNMTYCHCLQILGDLQTYRIAELDCYIVVSSFLEYMAVPTPTLSTNSLNPTTLPMTNTTKAVVSG